MVDCKCGEVMICEDWDMSGNDENEYYECENCGQKMVMKWVVEDDK